MGAINFLVMDARAAITRINLIARAMDAVLT